MRRFALSPLASAVSAALPAALLPAPAAAQVEIAATGPVVELNVTERVEAEPSLVRIGAGVTSRAPSAVEAMGLNAQAMAQVIARLRQLGIAERSIQTAAIDLNAAYDHDQQTGRQVFAGYEAANRVSVELDEVGRTGEVLDALVAAGATDLTGPSFALDEERTIAARAQARSAAMATAREQALAYARLAGFSDIRLLRIAEGMDGQVPQPMMRDIVVTGSRVTTPVQPGLVEEAVTVTVSYELTR